MISPFYEYGYFTYDFSLLIAVFIGIAFGFFLERGGLGDANKLAAQFYFTDLTVFKVNITAIITAMLGIFWLSWSGFLDLELVYLNPTYILPQLVAGLVFGIGFVMSGLCPGTSCVALATGKIDGLFVLLGIILGIFLFGEFFDTLSEFFYSTSMGQVTIPRLIELPYGVVVLIVVVLAIAGFAGATKIEKARSYHAEQNL